MVKLEQLTTGALVSGLQAGGPVTIVATLWYGESVMEVIEIGRASCRERV